MSEQLRHKIVNLEVAPPAAAWDAIAARLDDDRQYAVVSAKMNSFELAPPPMAWNLISAALEENPEAAPVISVRRNIYRLLAAAAVIGIIAVTGWLLLNNTNRNADTASIPPAQKDNPAVAPSGYNKPATNDQAVVKNQEAAVIPHAVTAATTVHHSAGSATQSAKEDERILRYAVLNQVPSFAETPIIISSAPITDQYGNIIRDLDVMTTSNYIMVTGPNGQLTRISSKFASVIRYLNGDPSDTEEYIDRVIKESDTWKKRFQEWRSKISQSSFIPSSANFLDIIEFKDLIDEKQ